MHVASSHSYSVSLIQFRDIGMVEVEPVGERVFGDLDGLLQTDQFANKRRSTLFHIFPVSTFFSR